MVITAGSTHPRNLAPTGPSSKIWLTNASPSISGGAVICWPTVPTAFTPKALLRMNRQVIRIGCWHAFGGTITRMPLCRQPCISPPRASTRKETRKLEIFDLGQFIIYDYTNEYYPKFDYFILRKLRARFSRCYCFSNEEIEWLNLSVQKYSYFSII